MRVCPEVPGYYAYHHVVLGPLCVLYCPDTYFMYLPNRTCLQDCPAPSYFRDLTTKKCVEKCPDHLFAETINQECVANCSINSKYGLDNICHPTCSGQYNMDPTRWLCVKACPLTYFSESNLCTQSCLTGYGDPITQKCEPSLCSPGYYSQESTHLCVQSCQPEYRYDSNQTCLA